MQGAVPPGLRDHVLDALLERSKQIAWDPSPLAAVGCPQAQRGLQPVSALLGTHMPPQAEAAACA